MKVLVATEQTQGHDPADYCWTSEGELVRIADCPDRHCRCTGFAGVESRRCSSTALVVERADLDPDGLRAIFEQHWRNGGWGECLGDHEIWAASAEDVVMLMDQIDEFPPGTVVGRAEWCGPVVARTARDEAGG